MTILTRIFIGLLAAVALSSNPVFAIHDYPADAFWLTSNEQNTTSIDHSAWQTILDQYLETETTSGINLVDYARLKGDGVELLDSYLSAMSQVTITDYAKAEQFAFWVNLYNAATVKLIVDAYPVKSIMKLGGWFSIGPWDDEVISVQSKQLTLNDIEHRILRPIWQDYRIHFVVNCASLGCPNLYPEALQAQNSPTVLDAAAKEFLQHPRGFSLNDDRLELSKIFKWYSEDFGKDRQALLKTLKPYLRQSDQSALNTENLRVRYQYDWDLNDAN